MPTNQPRREKTSLGVCDQIRFTPAFSATETSKNFKNLHVGSLYVKYVRNRIIKGAEQTAGIRRLVWTSVVGIQQIHVFTVDVH